MGAKRAVRILDEKLGEILAEGTPLVASLWQDSGYWDRHRRSDRRQRLTDLWHEWVAVHDGPVWKSPGVIVTRRSIEFTARADGTGERFEFRVERKGGGYWLVEVGKK